MSMSFSSNIQWKGGHHPYESRLGCLENSVPQPTVDYIEALGLMFSMFKTSCMRAPSPGGSALSSPNPGWSSAGPGTDSSNSAKSMLTIS